jgi:hypothetical protein
MCPDFVSSPWVIECLDPNNRREEFRVFQDACVTSPLYKEAIAQFDLPEGFEVMIDPW